MKGFFWDVFLGRLVPVLFFGAAALANAFVAQAAQVFVERSVLDALRFLSAVASFFFFAGLTLTYLTRAKRRSGMRKPLVLVAVVVNVLLSYAALAFRGAPRPGLEVVGAIFVIVATTYELYALFHLRSSFAVLPEARALVTTGPYAWSRNPLYVAEMLAMLGMLLPSGAIALLVVPVALGQWLRVRWEEQVLAAEFPDAFRDYAARVPRWLPFLR